MSKGESNLQIIKVKQDREEKLNISINFYMKELKYSFYLITHPFNGFWEIKHERKGSIRMMWTFLVAVVILRILIKQLTGYLFNYSDPLNLNIFSEVVSVILVFLLWCTANWCLTSLMDGEGSYKDICIMTAYSLLPYILMQIPALVLSNILSGREASLYKFMIGFSLIWAAGLLIFGTMVTHQYTFGKTILTVILTIVGMGIITFIGLLFINLLNQMFGFATNMYKEISLREMVVTNIISMGGQFHVH
jgi:hypothetical protein